MCVFAEEDIAREFNTAAITNKSFGWLNLNESKRVAARMASQRSETDDSRLASPPYGIFSSMGFDTVAALGNKKESGWPERRAWVVKSQRMPGQRPPACVVM